MKPIFILVAISFCIPPATAQRKAGSPVDNLPPNIEILTGFGERADFLPDNKRVAFMSKSFGDAMVVDIATKKISCLTCRIPAAAFLRLMHLVSGDYKFNEVAQGAAMQLADPTIFVDKGNYYLYGTGDPNGFRAYISQDLKTWKPSDINDGYALKKDQAFGTSGFWAPQVFNYKGKYYMAYTANENIAIALGNHPAGPFTQEKLLPLSAPVKQIDPFVFIDDNGKKYLYHVRLDKGNRIFVAEMEDDFSAIKPATLRECIAADQPWENTSGGWPVAEGPSVMKKNGVYYLFYSANDFRNPDYAVGYATSESPLGPWKKFEGNPILNKQTIDQNGTGHGDFFVFNKQLHYIFHTHFSQSKVGPRKTAVIKAVFDKNKWQVDPKSFIYLEN